MSGVGMCGILILKPGVGQLQCEALISPPLPSPNWQLKVEAETETTREDHQAEKACDIRELEATDSSFFPQNNTFTYGLFCGQLGVCSQHHLNPS